jgi:photosystem II stability/assembly factor-like uncharacterized protein
MKILLSILVSFILFYSCSTQKETLIPKEKEKTVVEPAKKLTVSFEALKTKTNTSLHSISVLDSLNIWACGTNGIYLKTTDGGSNWQSGKVKGFETLDFRCIKVLDANTAIIMCTDAPAFFFKTTDGGKTWKRKYMSRDVKVSFNGMTFKDSENGIAFSDPIDERFFIITTSDAGDTWKQISSLNIPPARKGEKGIAISGTSISVSGKDLIWFGTENSDRSRIFFSQDAGINWRAIDVYSSRGNGTNGISSICFKDELNGIAVGGNPKDEKNNSNICVSTDDGGLNWQPVDNNQPAGFKSCIAWSNEYKFYLSTGKLGSSYSLDDGKTWVSVDSQNYNSIGISEKDGSCFVVGNKGIIAKVKIK